MPKSARFFIAPLRVAAASTPAIVSVTLAEVLVRFQVVGDGAREEVIVVPVIITEEEPTVVLLLSSLLCVTIQYDCHLQGLQSSPTEGFHS
jgi:hypothetical protein